MTLSNLHLTGRNSSNRSVTLRPGYRHPISGGSINNAHVDPKVSITNGIQGLGTSQIFTPKKKESPVFKAQNNSVLADFKSLNFGTKKKTNIKLKL